MVVWMVGMKEFQLAMKLADSKVVGLVEKLVYHMVYQRVARWADDLVDLKDDDLAVQLVGTKDIQKDVQLVERMVERKAD